MNEAEKDVLRADVVVVEHPGFFLSQDNNAPRAIGEPLEHRSPSHSPAGRFETGCLVPGRRVSLRHYRLIASPVSGLTSTNRQRLHDPTYYSRGAKSTCCSSTRLAAEAGLLTVHNVAAEGIVSRFLYA